MRREVVTQKRLRKTEELEMLLWFFLWDLLGFGEDEEKEVPTSEAGPIIIVGG